MKPKLCSALVVLFIAVLSATAVHADEGGGVAGESMSCESVLLRDAIRYYSGIGAATKEADDRKKGTCLMTAAFVAQGISLSSTVVTLLGRSSELTFFNTVLQMSTIPFAPMGVHGFALRFGSSDEAERLRWTGIGLLQAAAFSGGMGALTFATIFVSDYGLIGAIPAAISHFGASIAFVIAGGISVGVAKAKARRQGNSQSPRSPTKSTHRGFVMPTIAPRPGGVSLGLTGVF